MRNGCIYVGSKIAVWPSDYTLEEAGDEVRVLDQDGTIVVQIGRYGMESRNVRLKGRLVNRDDDYGIQIGRRVNVDCPSTDYWIVK